MSKRLATVATAVAFAALTAFGAAGSASATAVPEITCFSSSDPISHRGTILCTLNVTVQVPIDRPECVLTISDIETPSSSQFSLIYTIIEYLVEALGVEDRSAFEHALALDLQDIGIDVDVSRITLDCS